MIFQTHTLPVVVATTLPALLVQAPANAQMEVVVRILSALPAEVVLGVDFEGVMAQNQEGYQMIADPISHRLRLSPKEKLYAMNLRTSAVVVQFCIAVADSAELEALDDGGGIV